MTGDFNTPSQYLIQQVKTMNSKDRRLEPHSNQADIIEIYQILYLRTIEYTFFLSISERCIKIVYMLGHKANSNKFQKTEILQRMLLDHNSLKLEVSNIKLFGKFPIFGK